LFCVKFEVDDVKSSYIGIHCILQNTKPTFLCQLSASETLLDNM